MYHYTVRTVVDLLFALAAVQQNNCKCNIKLLRGSLGERCSISTTFGIIEYIYDYGSLSAFSFCLQFRPPVFFSALSHVKNYSD